MPDSWLPPPPKNLPIFSSLDRGIRVYNFPGWKTWWFSCWKIDAFAPLSAKDLIARVLASPGVDRQAGLLVSKGDFCEGREAKLEIPLRGLPVRCFEPAGVFWAILKSEFFGRAFGLAGEST